eukprot:5544088-Prymnesium_polylepis.2
MVGADGCTHGTAVCLDKGHNDFGMCRYVCGARRLRLNLQGPCTAAWLARRADQQNRSPQKAGKRTVLSEYIILHSTGVSFVSRPIHKLRGSATCICGCPEWGLVERCK